MADLDPFDLVKRRLYCSGPTIPLRRWFTPTWGTTPNSFLWPQLRDRAVIGTYRGRTAIALACRLLGLGQGDEVLVPAYNCGTELDALLHMGVQLVAFPVSRRGDIALDDIKRQRTSRTKAVYVIHYFGWEQPLEELRRWCDAENLLLIEDCALALYSDGPNHTIGQTGDAAIFSLPKTLGISRGGLLTLPISQFAPPPPLFQSGFSSLLKEIQRSAKTTVLGSLERLGLYGALLASREAAKGKPERVGDEPEFPTMPSDYYFEPTLDAERGLHSRTQAVVASLNRVQIIQRRRANYTQLADAIAGIKRVEPLFPELPAGICPLSFPLLVSNRDAAVAFLQARGIAALPWWAGFHQKALEWSQFPDACWLKHHLLTLPIHQGLSAQHMAHVIDTVPQIASL